jgi:hypothetical protein
VTERIQQAEEELQTLKLEALKGELSIGINQVKNGAYTDYNDNSLPILLEDIKAQGHKRLGQNSPT